jgi:DNA polymerase III sliding clamp (beta) subunit (PCNA family)
MKFIANISRELRAIAACVAAKPSDLLRYVKITATNTTNTVFLTASTENEVIHFSTKAEVMQPGEDCYRLSDLAALFKEAKVRGSAEMEFDNENVAVCEVNKVISTKPVSKFPKLDYTIANPDQMIEIPRFDLGNIADRVAYACSNDPTKPNLTGVHFQGNYAAATNGHRIAQLRLNFWVKEPFMFPVSSLKRVSLLLNKTDEEGRTVQIGLHSPSEILVKADGEGNTTLTVQIKTAKAAHPHYQNLIQHHFSKQIGVSRKQWCNAIKELIPFSEPSEVVKGSAIVTLSQFDNDGGCTITGRSQPIAGLRLDCEIINDDPKNPLVDNNGDGYHINVEGRYLREAIAACSGEKVIVSFNGNTSPFVVRCSNDETHLLMPVTGSTDRNSGQLRLAKHCKPLFRKA